ncbi:hypothetical protein [Zwartia sp.]|uniref:hypothetical protein n=1 Tax=Zwartia sp. TaxID=2978004 RepID=UPI0027264491|nr:hypothetical protein [Zwartia sp.]MDO9023761.1 hypothetical protein [Zwartia sp.]
MTLRFALMLTGLFTAQAVCAQPIPSASQRPNLETDQWRYSITPYLWALGIRGSISHNDLSSGQLKLTPGDVLSDLKMAGMVVAEAHKNRFGLYLDAMYGDMGKSASEVIGRADLNASTTVKMSMVTLAPSFTLHNSKSLYLDGLIGARYLWLNANTTISDPAFGITLKQSSTQNITAAVAGLKGRWNLGDSDYFVPFYVDVGAGQSSSFTSQAYLGIGRSFEWGDVSLVAKNVYYQFKPNSTNVDMNLFGAAVAVTFRF